LLEYIKSDLGKLEKPGFISFLKWYFFPKGSTFRFQFWFRVLSCLRKSKIGRLVQFPVYIILRHYEYKYQVHANANIPVGKGLQIVHGDGVHLNAASIGENFKVYGGVTIGEKNGEIPVIEDNVTIYTGAVVCGGITLHAGCTIGANAFVDKDVAEGDIVAGIPAKSIKD
jgi:serine O-acetyltransferase